MTKINMVTHRLEGGQHLVVFSRGDNDMIIGSCCNGETRWGEDPTKQEIRCFTNHESGIQYIKEKCREYTDRRDIDFIHVDGDPLVQTAGANFNARQRRM